MIESKQTKNCEFKLVKMLSMQMSSVSQKVWQLSLLHVKFQTKNIKNRNIF
jgi:hypothetical protein